MNELIHFETPVVLPKNILHLRRRRLLCVRECLRKDINDLPPALGRCWQRTLNCLVGNTTRHQKPAGFQSTVQETKLVEVCGNDCNMTIQVDNTCLWSFDKVRRDSDEGGLLIGTPLKHMLNRVCPHCVIMGVNEKDMTKRVPINKWTIAWWKVCDVNVPQPILNQTMQKNRRQRRTQLLTCQQKLEPAEMCWLHLWNKNVSSVQPKDEVIVDALS